MFKYQILATTKNKNRPITVALTHFCDLAEFIADHAAEALDPDGTEEMRVHIVERTEADMFINRPRCGREEQKHGNCSLESD